MGSGSERIATPCHVEVLERGEGLVRVLGEWEQLAANAIDRNAFYEPYALMPALKWLAGSERIAVLLVWVGSGEARQLACLLPVQRGPLTDWCPLPVWKPWHHKYCFLETPLIHRDWALEAGAALAEWLASQGILSVVSSVGGEGFDCVLQAPLGSGVSVAEAKRARRALFRPRETGEAYLEQAVSGKHRKGYRRLERHLGQLGRLEYRGVATAEEAARFIDGFLALERAGWKGQQGTAFASSHNEAEFFRELVWNAFEQGRLMAHGLYLDDKPVALKVNFVSGEGSFSFKICFDESYGHFSPGVLLELENVRELHRRRVAWMDSCADEGHSMIERLWLDRREIRQYYLGPKCLGIASVVPAVSWARTLVQRWRGETKHVPAAGEA